MLKLIRQFPFIQVLATVALVKAAMSDNGWLFVLAGAAAILVEHWLYKMELDSVALKNLEVLRLKVIALEDKLSNKVDKDRAFNR